MNENEMPPYARFRIKCDGQVVAGCDGPLFKAWGGIMHYARQYAEEGAIRLEIHNGKRWVAFQTKLPSRRPDLQAIEAGTAKTEGLGVKHESAVGKADAAGIKPSEPAMENG